MSEHIKADMVKNIYAEKYNADLTNLDSMYPQTSEELATARKLLPEELKRRGLTGIPSKDSVLKNGIHHNS